jgi:EAL domain-containing protein (putative c-di-GMP-specific phosphodiesterase class I)
MPADRVGQEALDRALDEPQDLLLVYQPIHDARSKSIYAAEALLRQRRESGELREANIITETAEQGPELFVLDSITMRNAWVDAAQWMKLDPEVRLNLNLSPREFENLDIIPRLESLADTCGVELSRVNLEITETSYIDRPDETVEVMTAMRAQGAEIWLDDFGTRHSTISHLLQFDVDGVKIPGEFVAGLQGDQRCVAITRTIIDLAHTLGLRVIAEGAEKPEQLQFLTDCGCDYIQGFIFSRPMPLADFETLLASPPPERTHRGGDRDPASPSS